MKRYLMELETIQTWLKSTANLNSMRLSEAPPKVSRPIMLFEAPNRGDRNNITRYQYVQPVKWYGKLFVTSVDQLIDLQETLIQDLEEKVGVFNIKDENDQVIGKLKEAKLVFSESESLDVPFSFEYEVGYTRTKPEAPPPASFVGNEIIIEGGND